MANNQDIFILEENLPMLKFCLKKRLYPAKRGDGHWQSQIFWCLGQVITMTVCNRNYEVEEITNRYWVSLFWLTDLKILEHGSQIFSVYYPLDSDAKGSRTLPLPPTAPQCMITFNFLHYLLNLEYQNCGHSVMITSIVMVPNNLCTCWINL
jgi:hypothetical protein